MEVTAEPGGLWSKEHKNICIAGDTCAYNVYEIWFDVRQN